MAIIPDAITRRQGGETGMDSSTVATFPDQLDTAQPTIDGNGIGQNNRALVSQGFGLSGESANDGLYSSRVHVTHGAGQTRFARDSVSRWPSTNSPNQEILL
jgi:hypothetical protein